MRINGLSFFMILLSLVFFSSCDDKDEEAPVVDCSASGLDFTAETVSTACGVAEGSITVNSTGGAGTKQYSLNNGSFQISESFSGLEPGAYTVVVKDENECTTSKTVNIESGISFQASVKSIVDTNCAITGCHVAGTGRQDFSNFSNIKQHAEGIKSRTQSKDMPRGRTLSEAEIQQIACWVDDGAQNN